MPANKRPLRFTERIVVKLSPEMKAALDREAVRRGSTTSQLIRDLAVQVIKKEQAAFSGNPVSV